MLITREQFDATALRALEQLMQQCKQHDGQMIAYYPNLLRNQRPKPASLLQYNPQKQLIGFASVFFFEADLAEISLATAPEYRKQGIARQLLSHLLTSIEQERPVEIIRFSLPAGQANSKLTQTNFHYHHSEYDMHYTANSHILFATSQLNFILADPTHISILRELDRQCFPRSTGFSIARLEELLTSPQYCILLATLHEQIIGKAHLAFNQAGTRLSDIAIAPCFQNEGHGRRLIQECIHRAVLADKPQLTLSVETSNTHALTLYQQLGFQISNAIDFWQKPFTELLSGV